jgi:TfoX/Sxy family transcriptional regulator of competence genes
MPDTSATHFDAIAEQLLREPDTERRKAFHNPGLTVDGRIFAMLVRDELVLKLPAARCAELSAGGGARPFDRGQGKPLKEWVCVETPDPERWLALAREALAFVRR